MQAPRSLDEEEEGEAQGLGDGGRDVPVELAAVRAPQVRRRRRPDEARRSAPLDADVVGAGAPAHFFCGAGRGAEGEKGDESWAVGCFGHEEEGRGGARTSA